MISRKYRQRNIRELSSSFDVKLHMFLKSVSVLSFFLLAFYLLWIAKNETYYLLIILAAIYLIFFGIFLIKKSSKDLSNEMNKPVSKFTHYI